MVDVALALLQDHAQLKDVHVAPWCLQECVQEDIDLHSYGLLTPQDGVEDFPKKLSCQTR